MYTTSTKKLERKLRLKTSIYLMSKMDSTRQDIEELQSELERRSSLSPWKHLLEMIKYRRIQ